MMTIEEKAKAYDEANSIMGKYLKSGNASIYALKSFKDEDVRKFMQYIEKEAKAYDFNLPNRSYDIYAFAKDILAWLEKQKVTKQYKVGDKVTFDGIEGYVLEVDKEGEPTVLCSDIIGEMSWYDAMKNANQGSWHLPTVEAFKKYYEIVRELDGYEWNNYWASTECGSSCACCVYTTNGFVYTNAKTTSSSVRAFAYVGSKKESKPRSWEEYCKQVKNTECYICVQDSVMPYKRRVTRPQYNEFDTEEEAKAFIALGKLIKIHKAWVKDWKPDWTGGRCKYNIQPHNNEIIPIVSTASSRVLTFPTAEMRDEFLETFHDLIEEAKPLL